jgi:hypothetical protein
MHALQEYNYKTKEFMAKYMVYLFEDLYTVIGKDKSLQFMIAVFRNINIPCVEQITFSIE